MRVAALGELQRRVSVRCRMNVEAFIGEAALEEGDELGVVVDEKDPGRQKLTPECLGATRSGYRALAPDSRCEASTSIGVPRSIPSA